VPITNLENSDIARQKALESSKHLKYHTRPEISGATASSFFSEHARLCDADQFFGYQHDAIKSTALYSLPTLY